MKGRFERVIRDHVVVSDGAKGTMLQARGLPAGHCPDEWNLSHPEVVRKVHREYVEAGSQILVTNTFNSLFPKLGAYGLEGRADELVESGVKAARDAAQSDTLVAGSIPPSGRFIMPVGDASFDEAVAWYRRMGAALDRAGADLFWLETFGDILEIKAAIIGLREASALPIVAMMTFDASYRTVLGTPPQVAALVLEKMGASAVGANCSLGPEGILNCLRMMREVTSLPFVSQPNAGMPHLAGGETVFPESPERMASFVPDLLAAGVRVLGGCCGTGPDHIRALVSAARGCPASTRPFEIAGGRVRMLLASRTRTVSCGPGEPPLIIGERINPTGRKQFGEKLLAGDMSMVGVEARSQKEAGATALDINVGVAGGDERAIMPMAVREAQMAGVPLVIDSSDPVALEEGLKYAPGRPLINSVNGEAARLEPVLALARKYGAAVVALCLDDEGIPDSAAKRTAVADLIEGRAAAHGLERNDLLFDFLTLSVASAQKQLPETLCAVRSARLAGRLTLLGSSNISFGLPARDAVNAAFIAMSVEAGLDAVIMNPMHGELVRSLGAASLLAGRDPGAQRYMSLFRGAKDRVLDSKAAAKTDILTRLGDSIIDGVGAAVVQMVAEALASGLKPMDISARGLMPGMAEVGRRFKSNDMFLPQVMMAAETMQAAMGRLELELKDGTAQSSPLVLIATVEGDIHDLGKGIVAALLKNGGFRVHDAGKGVPATKIVELATQMQPAVIGLSALMTTTMVRMKETVQALGEAGINTPVMLGGAVLTPEYAESIGAHYGADAVDAVELARKLAGKT